MTESRTFTQLYIPHVDSASHEHGSGHDVTRHAIASVNSLLEQVSAYLPPNAAMVVSADHGLLDVDANANEIQPDDELVGYLEHEPWGTAPSVMLQVRDDQAVEFEARFRERFGEDFYLLSTDEVLELELLGPGPVSPVTRRRMGNYLALSAGSTAIYFKGIKLEIGISSYGLIVIRHPLPESPASAAAECVCPRRLAS